jgi:N-acetyl-1-D-myo-inositol-2-amino-2-deoxy-alpha-D-glucopyranoside deacetylase
VQGQADLPFGVAEVDDLPFGVDDELVTTAVDATGCGDRKLAALRAHRTQIAVDGVFFALSNMLGREAMSVEYFRLARGELGPGRDGAGRETDLFAGL